MSADIERALLEIKRISAMYAGLIACAPVLDGVVSLEAMTAKARADRDDAVKALSASLASGERKKSALAAEIEAANVALKSVNDAIKAGEAQIVTDRGIADLAARDAKAQAAADASRRAKEIIAQADLTAADNVATALDAAKQLAATAIQITAAQAQLRGLNDQIAAIAAKFKA